MNFHKSSIQFLNNFQWAIKRRVGKAIKIHMSNDISKYLGCPLGQDRIKRSTFSEVIRKFQKKLESWKARFLSRANKITLIKAKLASFTYHLVNCFKLTKTIMKN